MTKKTIHAEFHHTAQKNSVRDTENRRIHFAAAHPTQEVLNNLETTLLGLEPEMVPESRARYGSNHVTREK